MRFSTTLAALLLAVSGLFAQPPLNGLVSYYPFEGGSSYTNEAPATAPAHNLSVHQIAPISCIDKEGQSNQAVEFNIADPTGTLNHQDVHLYPTGSEDRSICLWINMSSYGDTQEVLHWGKQNLFIDSDSSFALAFDIDSLAVFGLTNRVRFGLSSSDFRLGLWNHLAVTYSEGVVSLYTNGTHRESVNGGDARTSTSASSFFVIGGTTQNTRMLKAQVDEICIYKRALTQPEINQLYDPTPVIKPIRNGPEKPERPVYARLPWIEFLLNGKILLSKRASNIISKRNVLHVSLR